MDSQNTSTKKMSTQKKTIIALSSVCVLFLVALITVVSVWAASSQTISSTLRVTYSATNVSATVTGAYMRQGDESYTSIGQASFAATDNSQVKSISTADDIALADEKLYVIFRYTFKNDSATTAFTVTLANDVTKTDNISVKYASAALDNLTEVGINGTSLNSITVPGGQTVYAYILVKLDSITNSASYSGDVSWTLAAVTD